MHKFCDMSYLCLAILESVILKSFKRRLWSRWGRGQSWVFIFMLILLHLFIFV